ncbi:Major facilitator superfamily domain, general substrate transporter [Cordyceps fumosorosea ARSEF 2679]|uniref:Major facilitator superfamily domain, general substrate transporter n=1 Tax=Cordyceps fumosorosea (strain ARSEF 2679) TaxID=1081104 RepID=A0A167LHW4_CORFA|nr:Major facilitator superfamily domain, general substrate transporter [Cordyceps fumosorosea ARSEF 2679]OAA53109.1 Major facilitator superfamily domain, general substrate transporter [Cordyceps fumosorosea ARSEF 2679]
MALAKPVRSAVPLANTLPEERRRSSADENDAQLVVLTDIDKTQGEFDYSEGGPAAWGLRGWLLAYLSNIILSGSSTNAIGWIMGIYVFVSYFFSVQIGRIFDARGPRELIFIGTVFLIVGTFTLAQCTGQSGSIPRLKALQSLLPRVGSPWTVRVIGVVLLLLCIASLVLCKSRLPPRHTSQLWRQMLPSWHIFRDGTGAMAFTSAGVFFVEWAYFVLITYIPSYYLTRQGLSGTDAIGGDAAFAYQLL